MEAGASKNSHNTSSETVKEPSLPSPPMYKSYCNAAAEHCTPYILFTPRHKRLLAAIIVLTMLASPLTATIYLPLLPLLADRFKVSSQEINLTITIHMVFQALSPLLFATASSHFGRRPIYLLTYALYTVASLGLALNKHSYAALLILRAL